MSKKALAPLTITVQIELSEADYTALLSSALNHDLTVERRAHIALRDAIRAGLK